MATLLLWFSHSLGIKQVSVNLFSLLGSSLLSSIHTRFLYFRHSSMLLFVTTSAPKLNTWAWCLVSKIPSNLHTVTLILSASSSSVSRLWFLSCYLFSAVTQTLLFHVWDLGWWALTLCCHTSVLWKHQHQPVRLLTSK